LPEDCLEAVRLLTNLETEKSKLLHVVLFGQPELDVRLENTSVRQLKQRITFTHRLSPLVGNVVCSYLDHRMKVAGHIGPAVFDKNICRRIYKASGGVPRLVNILAHKCLMLAYGEGVPSVTAKHLKMALADTESIQHRGKGWRYFWFGLFGMAASTAAIAGIYLLNGVP
jgi:MSHA biogenesis protein MshM